MKNMMNISNAIKAVMKATKTTQKRLVDLINVDGGNVKSQSVIAQRLTQENISVNVVAEMLDAMGYEMILQPKHKGDLADNKFGVIRVTGGDEK